MRRARRQWWRALLGASVITIGLGAFADTASAHPLGNLSVNHFHELIVQPDRLVDHAVVDTAEIPTAQLQSSVDTDRDGTASPDELAQFGRARCRALGRAIELGVDGQPVPLTVVSTSFVYRSGQASLPTGRLECTFDASLDVSAARTVMFTDAYLADRVGWHEIVAVGDGVTLVNSPVPRDSISNRLERYPDDLLSSPLDVKKVALDVRPGAATAPAPPAAAQPNDGLSFDGLGPFADVVERVDETFNDLIGRRDLTLGVGLLAIGLALVVGASHALLPGHGKTVMAAYIAGTQGSVRDAVYVGATVTATHTGGVLALGLALTLSSSLAGEVVLGWLGLISGLLIAVLGVNLVLYARRGDPTWHGHSHAPAGHAHKPARHDHDHHDHDHHGHDHHDHDHHHHGRGGTALLVRERASAPARPAQAQAPSARPHVSRRGLLGMGVAGGLVPSPSALVVLLSAIALGRTIFGVILVIAYGAGMAATLTLAGILLVRVRDRYAGRLAAGRGTKALRRWRRIAPFATASLVIIVGLGLALRSLSLV